MTYDLKQLKAAIGEMAALIESNDDLDPQLYTLFLQYPETAFQVIDLINELNEEQINDDNGIYSASIYALEICVAQLQAAIETNNKVLTKTMNQLMAHMALVINQGQHSLSFWLPILNAFYEGHIELSQDLKDAYFSLALDDETLVETSDETHLNTIQDMIAELADLSVYEITEHFFAQSYAMPPDFFIDLISDLFSINEGKDIAILTLLHPNAEVRDLVLPTFDQFLSNVTLSSQSLSRLETIKHWYPEDKHALFNRWIKNQRKHGVTFEPESVLGKISIKATEVDGTGAQGLFIQVNHKRKNKIASILLKHEVGIKDAWTTPNIPLAEVKEYYQQAFAENVTLRPVDSAYLKMIVEHFLAETIEHGNVPNVHFLEIQELLGLRLKPTKLDLDYLFEQLGVQISPFTQEFLESSLQRSKSWLKNKKFTESWYLENPLIDKIVNHNSSFVSGVKVCRMDKAMDAVFEEEMELHRKQWEFYFLWLTLWFKSNEKKNEKFWQDSFVIAYVIRSGRALKDIPVMKEICHQTVINSVETMQERRTHLSQE